MALGFLLAITAAEGRQSDEWPLRYRIPASETDEGKERIRAYYEALGRFATMYAEVEATVQRTLWHYAKTPESIARSVFSGTRVITGASYIRRICEATAVDAKTLDELTELFTQLSLITKARDQILHYGAQSIAEGAGIVTNALLAHTPQKVTMFPISPAILDDMTADLRRVILTLLVRHMGRPPRLGALGRKFVDDAIREPWRYKPPTSPPPQPRKRQRRAPRGTTP